MGLYLCICIYLDIYFALLSGLLKVMYELMRLFNYFYINKNKYTYLYTMVQKFGVGTFL